MTDPGIAKKDEHGRLMPPLAGDEAATLLGFLEYQRATLEWKTSGLDSASLGVKVGVSSMTPGGLLKHLAVVEDMWFTRMLHDQDWPPPWASVDWKADPDWEWNTAAEDTPEHLREMWRAATERSRAAVLAALADGDLGQPARRTWPDGQAPSLRWIICHMIEEYARHNGHVDLMRETVDSLTGE